MELCIFQPNQLQEPISILAATNLLSIDLISEIIGYLDDNYLVIFSQTILQKNIAKAKEYNRFWCKKIHTLFIKIYEHFGINLFNYDFDNLCINGLKELYNNLLYIYNNTQKEILKIPDNQLNTNISSVVLCYAVMTGNYDIIKKLVENGYIPSTDVNDIYAGLILEFAAGSFDKKYNNAIHEHIGLGDITNDGKYFGYPKIINYLLKNTNIHPSSGDNILIMLSCAKGYTEIVKFILEDERTEFGISISGSLCFACEYGHVEIVEMLLKEDSIDTSYNCHYALTLACRNIRSVDIIKLYLKYGAPFNIKNIIDACRTKNFALIKLFVDDVFDIFDEWIYEHIIYSLPKEDYGEVIDYLENHKNKTKIDIV
jgi:ankyrin repeat protein